MIGLPRKTLFIDRDSGGRTFRDIVKAADINVVLHDEQFDPRTDDHVWLKKIGKLGFALATGDIAVERSYLFLTQLRRSNSHVFILCGLNHSSRDARSKCIIDAYPEIVRLCFGNQGPRLWKQKSGEAIVEVDFKHTLGLLKRYGKSGNIRM